MGRMCELLGVSRSSFHRHWRASKPKREQTALRDEIQRLALDNKHYGYRRISALLKRQGWCVNHKRVLRLMREDNLLCLRRKGFVPATTNSAHPFTVYPNLAHRLLTTATNQLWVADITYVRLEEGFAYLAVVLDAHSRKVIGWELADHLRAELALAALDRALLEREVIPGGLIHHSDRGVLGEFNRSSQHSGIGGYYDGTQTAVGLVWTEQVAFARSTGLGTA